MKDDENTARGPARTARAPIVRSTAPAGTPSQREGSPYDAMPATVRRGPSDRPMETLTPPRTVGGQTARLKIPDSDQGTQGTQGTHGKLGTAGAAPDPAPGSRTVGGTMRLAPAPTLEPPIPDVDWDSKPAPAPVPAVVPPAPAASAPRGAPAAAPIPLPPPRAASAASSASQAATPRAGEGDAVDWWSPLPVGVGLIFFAVGCMVGMTIDGRMRPPAAQPVASATAGASVEPPAPVKPTIAAPTAVAPAVTASARPVQPPHGPGVSTGPGGKRPGPGPGPGGRPGLPF